MKKEISWLEKPTKMSILIIGLILLFGCGLSMLAMTDLFRESLLQAKNALMILWMIGSMASYYAYILRYQNLKH